ncbi:MAG TPA: phytochelatin synthase family protein, partial [Alphaproteobacteria bacterium]|nr:phytochelatin synthase family protein [Alphaproteobacteria bacterium]
MKRFSAFAFLLCLAVPVSVAWAGDYQLPPNLIPLVSPEGRALLLEAEGQRAFLPLVSQFTTQQTQE